MKKIYEGRTKEDAIREACRDLNVDKENLIVEVLDDEEPKKTMFSILDRKRIKIQVEVKKTNIKSKIDETNKNKDKQNQKENKKNKKRDIKIDSETLEENVKLLEKVLDEFSILFKENDFKYTIDMQEKFINVSIDVNKSNKWIGYRGRNLNALQNIFTTILASNSDKYAKVYVNIGKYKEERKKQLENLAEKVSKTVIQSKEKVKLEPMSSYERKIIHDYIANDDRLESESTGEEPNRKVVISLK